MQVKELQARLDTGDGCKYTSIDNVEREMHKSSLYRYGNITSTLVLQVVAIYVIWFVDVIFIQMLNVF